MKEHFEGESFNIKQEKLQRLKELFPEVFTENRLDWEKLKALFGDDINFANERYVLNWAGKADAFRVLQQPTTATLKPLPEESYLTHLTPNTSPEGEGNISCEDFIKSPVQNIFIEGENLEVLKALQKAYYGKVKCIIIDPPYNTGSDSFIYPDRFSEKKDDYLKRIGDKDEEGYLMKEGLFRKNSKDSGHFHSNWLSMMYPRLFLAKNLLRDDGVIFVHIDDNEAHNLRLIMNEIFGEENFVGQISVQSNPRGRQSEKFFATVHEYLIVYAKNINLCSIVGAALSEEQIKDFKYEDSKGKYRLLGLRQRGAASRRVDRPLMYFPIYVNPSDNKVSLAKNKEYCIEVLPKKSNGEDGRWMWSSKKIADNIDLVEARLISRRNEYDVFVRDYLEKEGDEKSRKVNTVWLDKELNNQNGTVELKILFNDKKFFDFPKPSGTAKKILSVVNVGEEDIILDFFAGSGTTAQAVLELNKEDGGNRRFILVQMPEPCDEQSEAFKAGYKTIADIAKERIRRVIRKLEDEKNLKIPLNPPFTKGEDSLFKGDEYDSPLEKGDKGGCNNSLEKGVKRGFGISLEKCVESDCNIPSLVKRGEVGFKVFKLSPSNFKIWRGSDIDSEEKLLEQLSAFTEPVKPETEKENMLYELMLKAGYELTSPVQHVMVRQAHHDTTPGTVTLSLSKGKATRKPDSMGYYSINNNELIIALDAMNEKIVGQIIASKPQKVITLDSLFSGNDQLKTNTVLQMRDAGIDFKTI